MNDARHEYFQLLVNNEESVPSKLNTKKLAMLQAENTHGNVLYKYCNFDTAYKIIKNGNILLKAPDNFNDPYDCLSGISIFDQRLQFSPDKSDLNHLSNLLAGIPDKFPKDHQVLNNLRSSYCFGITCFSSSYKNPLMWSHYADKHQGVCIEFGIADIIDELHPCYYVDSMPSMSWQSKNVGLALIKCYAWNYECEWRLIRKTIRPVMRMFGSVSHQIYNSIHKDIKFSEIDHEEWSCIHSAIQNGLEQYYQHECSLLIKPSRIFLGLRYDINNCNEVSRAQSKEMLSLVVKSKIPIHKMVANHKIFDLADVIM